MGQGYWILVWDCFSSGLVMVNARLHHEGTDINKNQNNWWPCDDDTTDEEIMEKHSLRETYEYFRIIR